MSDTPESGAPESDQATSYYGSPAGDPPPPGQAAPLGTQMPSGQPGLYSQPGTYGQPAAYGQPGAYGPPGAHGQPGGYAQPGPSGQPAAYVQPAGYGQPATYVQPAGYGQPGQNWPQAADLRPDSGPAPVLVSFPATSDQSRLTAAFRAILAIPQLFALAIVSAVGGVVAFIGWWAALFTGQLPGWAHQLLAGVVRWSTRVSAYLYLVTGTYPPFSLDDTDYPVRLITKPTRLNPMAVLFRYFLMLPVGIVAGAASLGLAVLSVVAWVIMLITGRMPTSMHQAFSAIIRFIARYTGYAYMVTPEYPSGLYGDQPEPALWPTAPGFAASQATVGANPFETGAPGYAPPGTPPASVQAPPAPESGGTQADDPWRLTLSSRAKALVTTSLVIGAIVLAAFAVLFVAISSAAVSNATALANLNSAYSRLDSVVKPFPSQTIACGQDLGCVTALDAKVGRAFQAFGTSLQQAGVPTAYSGDEARLASDTAAITADFGRLGAAQSASQYAGIVAGMSITSTLGRWQDDFNALESALSSR